MSNRLRIQGVQTEVDYAGKSLKSQMKRADKLRCRYTLILGEQEITANKAQLRDMHDATQQSVDLDSLEDTIIHIVKGK
jgi:histidyl-tRNA synthetase